MATFIQAVARFAPRRMRLPRVRLGETAIRLADITGLRKDDVTRALFAPRAAMQNDRRRAASVKRQGIGPFVPTMRAMRAGRSIRSVYRPDRAIVQAMGNPVEAPMAGRPVAAAP